MKNNHDPKKMNQIKTINNLKSTIVTKKRIEAMNKNKTTISITRNFPEVSNSSTSTSQLTSANSSTYTTPSSSSFHSREMSPIRILSNNRYGNIHVEVSLKNPKNDKKHCFKRLKTL